jgi:mono/diheme cytochrome c family protein
VQISRPSRPAEGLAEAVVENILMTYCGACHGPLLGNEALGGIGFIDDVEELTARGYIVPLNSAASRIIAVMRDGSMPPRNTAYARVAEADIDVIVQFIDNSFFWPGVPVPLPVIDAGTPAATVDAGADAG